VRGRLKLGHAGSNIDQVENLEQILSTLRHEIGNSVNSLKVTLDVLRENYDRFDDEKKKDYLKRGSDLIARQVRLVEAMKSYSRFDVTEQEEISFQSLWEQFLTTWSSKLKDSNIRFIHHLEVGPCLVWGNGKAIQQALTNILDNAVESVEGIEDPTIEMRATEDNGFVMLLVKDNGPGIETKNMQKVFTPLFATKPGKMGMGLPIARKLLSKMDGRIEIYSPSDGGTEAGVWLRIVED
jgi:C4-dicarboxylate-specific signal transduction histidine kinase